jgi:hypothetical protein
MTGLPAVFAGDPTYKSKTRVFGLVTPDNPEYMALGDEIENGLKRCGTNIAKRVSYTINVAQFGSEGTSMAAQLKTSGVTTVLCYCDPLIPIFISQAADQQQYKPEWTEPNYRDPQGRLMSQQQWAHAISNGGSWPAKAGEEAYKVFKIAAPNAEPRPTDQYFDVAYVTLLDIFNALQAAGPNLNPGTLQQGMFSLPPSQTGDYGTWGFGPGAFSPGIDTQLGYWDPNATSAFDGKKGAWVSCEGGKWMHFDNADDYGPPHTQPHCFGK